MRSYAMLLAMVWSAVQLGGAGSVTLLTLSATVPRTLALLFGGAVADLMGPRVVLLRTTSARTAVLIAGAAVAAGTDGLWPLLLVAFADGALLGLGGPASGGLMPRLAVKDHLARANSLSAMVLRIAPVAGAPLGAWLISVGQSWQTMALAAATSAVWFAAVAYVTRGMARPAPQPGTSVLRGSADGFRLLRDHRRLRWLFVISLCLDLAFNCPAEVALPLVAAQRDWGAGAVGLVLAAFSAGALVSSALGAVMAHRIPVFAQLVISSALLASGVLIMALLPTVALLVAVACVAGMVSGINEPALVTAYQRGAPPSRMGAAMASLSLAGIGVGPLSIAVFSTIALGLGVQQTWVLCGSIALIAPLTAVAALRAPDSGEPDMTVDADAPAGEAAGKLQRLASLPDAARGERAMIILSKQPKPRPMRWRCTSASPVAHSVHLFICSPREAAYEGGTRRRNTASNAVPALPTS